MTKDLNKGMTNISYNLLNLPNEITHNDGNKLRTTYTVQPAGVLIPMTKVMQKESLSNSPASVQTLDYCGNTIYDNGSLSSIQIQGGFITKNDNQYRYHYNIADHLGNNRIVASEDGTIEQTNHYYPFGALFGESTNDSKQRYKYNGKELDRMNGLNLYDYGARNFDAALTRWTCVDPMCEKYHSVSPYVYCLNNPIKFVDPDGRDTYLYATTLPGAPSVLNAATHTFIVVTDKKGDVQGYFAYGSEYDGIKGAFGGQLVQRSYDQDLSIIKGQDKEDLKSKLLVDPPKGMTTESFDKKVMDVGNSFGKNPDITYNIIPTKPTEGNCNTSTSTILLKAGVSKSKLEKLEKNIPGISTGFNSQPKPWYANEQKRAVDIQRKVEELERILLNIK